MIPYTDIENAEQIESPLTSDMETALNTWYDMYRGEPYWLDNTAKVKTLNIPAFISSEIARQITLEMKWNITAKTDENTKLSPDGAAPMNPRAEYLKQEFKRCADDLRQKLEQGCASGGMVIKPYPKGDKMYFNWVMDWSLFPVAFDGAGNLTDVIFKDSYFDGKSHYTRLERHKLDGTSVHITNRAFKSSSRDTLGSEVELKSVDVWAELEPEATIENAGGPLFGWYKVASANQIDTECPMGASVFSKAVNVIKDADEQYSRLLWEFEGSELAIDVDPMVLKAKQNTQNGQTTWEAPKLNERLFRGVDLGADETYHVFSPPIRDGSILNGLNQILCRVEDLCGLARGTMTEQSMKDAMTATQLRILRQRSYATVMDNQVALERCLRDVIHAMDTHATLNNLAPEGEYEVSFEWDDSIITDSEQQANERLSMLNAGIISKSEMRQWYLGETPTQAKAAIDAITQEQMAAMQQMAALQVPEMPSADAKPSPNATDESMIQ